MSPSRCRPNCAASAACRQRRRQLEHHSQRSLSQFNRYASTRLDTKVASVDTLDTIKLKSSRVCPLVCEHGFQADGDRCVKIVCAEGSVLNDDNECEKRRDKKPVATRDRPESRRAPEARQVPQSTKRVYITRSQGRDPSIGANGRPLTGLERSRAALATRPSCRACARRLRAGARFYFAWGCFRYFVSGPLRQGAAGAGFQSRTAGVRSRSPAMLTINAISAVLNTNEMMPCTVAVRRMILSVMPTSETCAVMPITNEK